MTGRLFSLMATVVFSTVVLSAAASASGEAPHWTYEGAEGPEHWATLNGDFAACGAGMEQSPVDLAHEAAFSADVETIDRGWAPFKPAIVNNGHTIQANVPEGNVTEFGGKEYDLLQVHFHSQSEHAIDGKRFPLEAHFVHKADDGSLMVLGVMLVEGAENAELAKIWGAMPSFKGEMQGSEAVDLGGLIPKNSKVFRYAGSLTTPPCTEIVNWTVFEKPVEVSAEQIAAFTKLYSDNARPLQSVNRRMILIGD